MSSKRGRGIGVRTFLRRAIAGEAQPPVHKVECESVAQISAALFDLGHRDLAAQVAEEDAPLPVILEALWERLVGEEPTGPEEVRA